LDELNAAPASVQAACFQLILDRRLGEYVLPPEWIPIAAGNRQTDRAAAQRMPTALANRFAHIDVSADLESWSQWAVKTGIAPVVLAFLRFRPALLHDMPADGNARAFPTPRAWASVAKIANAAPDIRQALVAGIVGDGAAAEFEGFCRIWHNLPSIADVIANPDGAIVPVDISAQYAISAALGRKADRANFDRIMRYAGRLPPEFRILTVMDATGRDADLKNTAPYTAWCIETGKIAA
jgi:hypothetical protein